MPATLRYKQKSSGSIFYAERWAGEEALVSGTKRCNPGDWVLNEYSAEDLKADIKQGKGIFVTNSRFVSDFEIYEEPRVPRASTPAPEVEKPEE